MSPIALALDLLLIALLIVALGFGLRLERRLRALRESQALYEQLGDPLNLARLRRLEGKVEELRGQFAAAEVHLNEARKGLLSEGRGREAAQASLDLALLYSRQGKALDTHQIARWTFPVFSAKSVQRETIFALLVLQWEAESDRINPSFISGTIAFNLKAPAKFAPNSI